MIINSYITLDSLGLFYLLQSIGSLIAAVISVQFLKHRFIDRQVTIVLFFWVFNMILPGIGYFLTIWIVYYLLIVEYKKQIKNLNYINMIEFENEFPKIQHLFGEAGISRLLNDDTTSASWKMEALHPLADNARRNDITLIKDSLSDKHDEVRLYAFAVIDNMERGINSKIDDKLQLFHETEETNIKVKIAEELAHLYWDTVYFKLTDNNMKKFIIREVEKYAKVILEVDPCNEKVNILLGKAYLEIHEFDKAEVCFIIAIEQGEKKEFIIPYLAEIFFLKRAFPTVNMLLNDCRELRNNALFHPIIEQWSKQ